MGTYTGKERAFVQYSKLDIVSNSLPENTYDKFSIGIFGREQEQIFIVFFRMAGIPSVKLEVCCSSWDFLYDCQDILEKFSRVDCENFKPEDLHTMLTSLGIRDITENLNKVPETYNV
jgi:hypothetical protein